MALMNEETRRRMSVLWPLAWPAIIERILATMVSYVDTAMVGSMGANGTAAVSVNGPALWLIGSAMMGIGVGYSVQVSNAVGAGDRERAKKITQQGFLAALVSGLLALTIYEVLGGQISVWMGAKEEILPHAVNYLRIYAAAYPFIAFPGLFSSVLRSMGNSRTPLLINTAANVGNAVLNFFLIYPTRTWGGFTIPFLDITVGEGLTLYGAGWGVEGAALASAVAMSLGGLATVWAAFHQAGYGTNLNREAMRPDRAIIRRALKLGVPSAIEGSIINMGQIAMTTLVAHNLSIAALAANSVGNVAEGFCYLPAMGVGVATVALVGQSVGAGSKEDAEGYGNLGGALAVGMTAVLSVILFIFAPNVLSIFNSDQEVVTLAASALRVMLVAEPLLAAASSYAGSLRGADDVKFPMYAGFIGMWVIRVPIAYFLVLVLHGDLMAVWFAMALDQGSRGILCFLRWKSKKWVHISGLDKEKAKVQPAG